MNNDENLNGELTIYNPSSTTFVKHFIAELYHMMMTTDYVLDHHCGWLL